MLSLIFAQLDPQDLFRLGCTSKCMHHMIVNHPSGWPSSSLSGGGCYTPFLPEGLRWSGRILCGLRSVDLSWSSALVASELTPLLDSTRALQGLTSLDLRGLPLLEDPGVLHGLPASSLLRLLLSNSGLALDLALADSLCRFTRLTCLHLGSLRYCSETRSCLDSLSRSLPALQDLSLAGCTKLQDYDLFSSLA